MSHAYAAGFTNSRNLERQVGQCSNLPRIRHRARSPPFRDRAAPRAYLFIRNTLVVDRAQHTSTWYRVDCVAKIVSLESRRELETQGKKLDLEKIALHTARAVFELRSLHL